MQEKKKNFKGLVQRLIITGEAFMANDLFTYASAGAYSFFLSAIPIILMVMIILIRIMHTSADVVLDLLKSIPFISDSLDMSQLLDSVMSIKSLGIFEIILGLSIFWMARRFFVSIQKSIQVIYKKHGKGKPIKENLLVVAGEVSLLILIVIMTTTIIAGNAFFNTALSKDLINPILFPLIKNLFRYLPLPIIFIFLFLIYFSTPHTRPNIHYCLFASTACTLSFLIVQFIFKTFINMARYNLVYGILSNIIVLLLEVYMFFFLFLFFTQFLYVSQFFDSFLLARIYLLPAYNDPNPIKQIERSMFIEPRNLYERFALHKKPGEIIFNIGEESNEVYYIWEGNIGLVMPNQVIELQRGNTFGEFACLTGGQRTATAIALGNVTILRIPGTLFLEAMDTDGEMSRRSLQMIADYVRKMNNSSEIFETSE